MLTIELAQKDASRETTQKELLSAGREQVVSVDISHFRLDYQGEDKTIVVCLISLLWHINP